MYVRRTVSFLVGKYNFILIRLFPVINVLSIFVKTLLIALQYNLIFFCETHHTCCRFFLKKWPTILSLLTSGRIVDFEETKTPGNRLRHWQRYFFGILLLSRFLGRKCSVLNYNAQSPKIQQFASQQEAFLLHCTSRTAETNSSLLHTAYKNRKY